MIEEPILREIVVDTETTGFEPSEGHKIIEIGAVELINHLPSGNTYHQYINPERDVPLESVNVHGLTEEFLKDYPIFSMIVTDFLDFVGDATLVAHNATFDMNFVNYQLKHGGFPVLKNKVIDTLTIARKKFPGAPATLDALCRRYDVDNSNRTYHGALLDSELLADVYLELIGGRQRNFGLDAEKEKQDQAKLATQKNTNNKPVREARHFPIPDDERQAHDAMLSNLKNPLWQQTG